MLIFNVVLYNIIVITRFIVHIMDIENFPRADGFKTLSGAVIIDGY